MDISSSHVIECSISLAGGLLATLVGYRLAWKEIITSPQYADWYAKFGTFFKVAGPFVLVTALVRLFTG